jgi:hypothetical protein
MKQQAGSDEPRQPERKRRLGPRVRYALFLATWIGLIAVAFNTFFAIKFHKEFVDRDQGWPGLRHHETIGYENIPGFETQWDTYYNKIHELGYRIGKEDSVSEVRPGGILAIGGSFTFGAAVEHEQAFAAVAANALELPVYNYGIGSYSYASVLLQLRDLEQNGVLEKLAPSIILLGGGNWLVDRSVSPLFPTAGLPFAYAYIGRQEGGLAVLPPPSFYSIDHFWKLADRYYPPGTDYKDAGLSLSRFATMFAHTPRVLAARAAGKFRYRAGHSDISSEELYRFVIAEIDQVAQKYGAQVVVLWMPLFQLELDLGLSRGLKLEHVLVDGGRAILKHRLGSAEFADRHPTASAHAAYGAAIAKMIQDQGSEDP